MALELERQWLCQRTLPLILEAITLLHSNLSCQIPTRYTFCCRRRSND